LKKNLRKVSADKSLMLFSHTLSLYRYYRPWNFWTEDAAHVQPYSEPTLIPSMSINAVQTDWQHLVEPKVHPIMGDPGRDAALATEGAEAAPATIDNLRAAMCEDRVPHPMGGAPVELRSDRSVADPPPVMAADD
jgi:hypothetical protein